MMYINNCLYFVLFFITSMTLKKINKTKLEKWVTMFFFYVLSIKSLASCISLIKPCAVGTPSAVKYGCQLNRKRADVALYC